MLTQGNRSSGINNPWKCEQKRGSARLAEAELLISAALHDGLVAREPELDAHGQNDQAHEASRDVV